MDEKSQQIRRLISRAERHMDREEWDEVSELCYQVLALDPANENAANKLRLVYLRKDFVQEMERQMFRMFDPEDDQPHQRRHKLGFSYACLSRWPGWYEDWDELPAGESPALEEGRRRLIADYLMGEDGAYNAARRAFDQALAEAHDWRAVLYWLARLYAQHGYFVEAAEALEQMAALGPLSPEACRLYGEVCWWRDNDQYICWVL
ncbi:MAG: tetratricopeptide repeat protein [Anaerolineae bacterium]